MPPHGWRRSLAPWAHARRGVYFRRSSFRAAPTTFICVLSWERELGRIAEDFLFIPSGDVAGIARVRSEEHTSELQSHVNLVCRLLLEKKNVHARLDDETDRRTAAPLSAED